MRESARFYVELHKLGVNIQCFDVGGGLGVDYEGTRSQSDCSVNYGLNEYANNIIWAIGDACEEHGLPHPTVITESGRAVTAHHTVLVSNIIGVERSEITEATPPADDAPRSLQSMWETWQEMHEPGTRRSLREWLHDSQMDLHDIHVGYSSGTFSLQERAWAEQLYLNMCHEVQKQLDPSNRAHRPIIDELQERMADKMYVNFSLFQSMPDAWGIDQLFPVLPLEGLNHAPERRAVLLDITCDSDGAIDHYVDGDGIATTMPMPEYDPENPPMLGFFMVGRIRRSSATCTTCSVIPKRLTCLSSLTAAWRLSCPTKGTPWRTCSNTFSWIQKTAHPVPRSGKKHRSGRCLAAAVPGRV